MKESFISKPDVSTGILDKIVKPGDCIVAICFSTSRDDFMDDLKSENKDFAREKTHGWLHYKGKVIRALEAVVPIMKKLGVTVIYNLTLNDFGKLCQESRGKIIILFAHWKDETNEVCFEKSEYLRFVDTHPDFLEIVPHGTQLLEWLLKENRTLEPLVKSGQEKNAAPLVELKEGRIQGNYKDIVSHHLKKMKHETYLELMKHSNISKVEFYDGFKRIYEILAQIPSSLSPFLNFLDLNVCQAEDLTIALRKCRPGCHFKYKVETSDNGEIEGVRPDIMLDFYEVLFKHLKYNEQTYLAAFEQVVDTFYEGLNEERRKF